MRSLLGYLISIVLGFLAVIPCVIIYKYWHTDAGIFLSGAAMVWCMNFASWVNPMIQAKLDKKP